MQERTTEGKACQMTEKELKRLEQQVKVIIEKEPSNSVRIVLAQTLSLIERARELNRQLESLYTKEAMEHLKDREYEEIKTKEVC